MKTLYEMHSFDSNYRYNFLLGKTPDLECWQKAVLAKYLMHVEMLFYFGFQK